MLTIITPEKLLFPKEGRGSFSNHEFFEASSIRKFNGLYYFIYSSRHNHELCYATSSSPTGGFEFQGTLISNGDVFLHGHDDENHANNYIGNTHGSILELNGNFYIFYHRHTDVSSYARQACAERLTMRDGKFIQSEITSCGLSDTPPPGRVTFSAYIACNLWASGHTTGRYDIRHHRRIYKNHPRKTETVHNNIRMQIVANMRNGATCGFKHFNADDIRTARALSVTVRSTSKRHKAHGKMVVHVAENHSVDSAVLCVVDVAARNSWARFSVDLNGIKNDETIRKYALPYHDNASLPCVPLYFTYVGEEGTDIQEFSIEQWLISPR